MLEKQLQDQLQAHRYVILRGVDLEKHTPSAGNIADLGDRRVRNEVDLFRALSSDLCI